MTLWEVDRTIYAQLELVLALLGLDQIYEIDSRTSGAFSSVLPYKFF
jgi:hypothetical protein